MNPVNMIVDAKNGIKKLKRLEKVYRCCYIILVARDEPRRKGALVPESDREGW